jgi:hypothetical protein
MVSFLPFIIALTAAACDDDARALDRPWAPVLFHKKYETSASLPVDARFTTDAAADETDGRRAVTAFNAMASPVALRDAYVPGSPYRANQLARRAATDVPLILFWTKNVRVPKNVRVSMPGKFFSPLFHFTARRLISSTVRCLLPPRPGRTTMASPETKLLTAATAPSPRRLKSRAVVTAAALLSAPYR